MTAVIGGVGRSTPTLILLALTAWITLTAHSSCTNSDKISWSFVSNPSGDDPMFSGGAVIVIRRHDLRSASIDNGERWLKVDGADASGPLSVHMLVGGDAAVLDDGQGLELRCRALATGRLRLSGARLTKVEGPLAARVDAVDQALFHRSLTGGGTAWLATRGNLVVLESSSGLMVFDGVAEPRVLPTHRLTVDGDRILAIAADNRITVLTPTPPVGTSERLVEDRARGSIRLLGPRREPIAELRSSEITLHGGAAGLFLTAVLPSGAGRDRTPLHLTMARDNRYLLRVEL